MMALVVARSPILNASVLAVVLASWWVFLGAFVFRRRPPMATEARRDRTSIAGIVVQGVSFAIVWMGFRFRGPFRPLVEGSLTLQLGLGALAIALAVVSVWTTLAAVRTLGRQWSLAARLVEGHQLITVGPYRIVRHPIYTAMLGMLLATGLAASLWPLLLVATIVFFAGTRIRVRSEEKLLRETFGAEYEDYVRRVRALIPLVY